MAAATTTTTTKKPTLPPLQTPQSASFPSEIVESPAPPLSAVIKQENGLKTPITPPLAYTEFLKALTPVLTSPKPAPALPRTLSSDASTGRETPTSNPSTSSSFSFSRQDTYKSPVSSASVAPPSPFVRPNSARTPTSLRRLTIPQSPAASPRSAATLSTCLSSAAARSPFSPADWNLDSSGRRYFEQPRSATRPVSVRSVVTRTVVYKRTPPLDPAPKGKKRKLDTSDMPPPSAVSPAAPTAVV